jgi:RNA polymerase sigma factor (sigma-70 family)
MRYIDSEKLSRADEAELIVAAQAGDLAARNRLVMAHWPFVRSYAKRTWRPYYMELEDIEQAAVIGLIKAIAKFDFSRGVKLLTYAEWWMRREVQWDIEMSQMYRVPKATLQMIQCGKRQPQASTLLAIEMFSHLESLSTVDQLSQLCPQSDRATDIVDARDAMEHATRVLDDEERRLVRLSFEGHSDAEIARIYRVTRQVMNLRIRAVLAKIGWKPGNGKRRIAMEKSGAVWWGVVLVPPPVS